MLQIGLSLFLVKEPYFPKSSVIPLKKKIMVERIQSVCAKDHKSDDSIYSSIFAFCEFVT